MSQEAIKKVLKDFGLTDKEADIYIFIAKNGALKGGEIAKRTKTNKAEIYRILKSLQAKGLLESTLESPTRYTALSFESVLDSNIKKKIDEADQIKETRKGLLDQWKNISHRGFEPNLEKFAVIEGTSKIYAKLENMIKETQSQLLAILTVPSLLRADQSGLLDVSSKRFSKPKLRLRFLTQLSEKEVSHMKALLKRKAGEKSNFVGRVPNLGLRPFPRLFIRDEEETLFFLKSKTDDSTMERDDVCLWTNSKEIVKAFMAVFEDYWHNATDIQKKIIEIETGIVSPETCIIKNSEEAREKYWSELNSARKEIILLMSSEGLAELSKNPSSVKEWTKREISVRILAPITGDNLNEALSLSECCEVRHVATSYLSTTVVDGQHLFQFKNQPPGDTFDAKLALENTFYSNDLEYVEKTRMMLNELWNASKGPSQQTLDSILESQKSAVAIPEDTLSAARKIGAINIADEELVSEKSIVDRILSGKKFEVSDPSKDLTRLYGFSAQAVVHPPNDFGLPDFMVHAFHNDKQSSYGVEDYIVVYLWLPTPKGLMYVPVAVVGDVPSGAAGFKVVWGGTPAGQNVRIVEKDELQVQLHGSTFFVGWTVPIPLFPTAYVLPPAAIMLEAFGDLKTTVYTANMLSRYSVKLETNGYKAFVTFYHPASRYSGPGTDGFINRDLIMTTTPP